MDRRVPVGHRDDVTNLSAIVAHTEVDQISSSSCLLSELETRADNVTHLYSQRANLLHPH